MNRYPTPSGNTAGAPIAAALLLLAMLISSCEDPRDLVSAYHYTRVPKPIALASSQDTTASGKYRVTLRWSYSPSDTSNLLKFEIYRRLPATTYVSIADTRNGTYADTTIGSFTADTLVAQYALFGIGKDRYRSDSSDTLSVKIARKP